MRRAVPVAALLALLCACSRGLSGRAVATDSADGMQAVNSKGKHPTKLQDSADIRRVELSVSGGALTIDITLNGPVSVGVPNDIVPGPDWFVQLWRGTAATPPDGIVGIVRRGTVVIQDQRVVAGWKVLSCIGSASCDTDAKGSTLSINGTSVHAEVPLKDLPTLHKPFTWAVFSLWNETTDLQSAFSDWVPDTAAPPKTGFTPPQSRGVFPS